MSLVAFCWPGRKLQLHLLHKTPEKDKKNRPWKETYLSPGVMFHLRLSRCSGIIGDHIRGVNYSRCTLLTLSNELRCVRSDMRGHSQLQFILTWQNISGALQQNRAAAHPHPNPNLRNEKSPPFTYFPCSTFQKVFREISPLWCHKGL